ncbi:MAG: class IV adenylate cyclase [Candidatus Saccharibacteria bacterium]
MAIQAEIEAKFLDIDHERMRNTLSQLGAICVQPSRLMRRKTYDFPDDRLRTENTGWVRVRDEGNKVTLSYKQQDDHSFLGTKEVSLDVDSFDEADIFLQAVGLVQKGYIETKRESWELDGAEIELDEWPWVKPYIEIEAKTEDNVQSVAKKLGLDWSSVCHGSIDTVYMNEYNLTEADFDKWPEIIFSPVPQDLEAMRK